MAASISHTPLRDLFELKARELLDPQTGDWMVDAVTFDRCRHTIDKRTAEACLERNLPCPVCLSSSPETHLPDSYSPNLEMRKIVHFFKNVLTTPPSIRNKIASIILFMGDATTGFFTPKAEKKKGSSLGTIYSDTAVMDWIGKVGLPTGLLRNDICSRRTRTRKDMNLDNIFEKIAADLYTVLGQGLFGTAYTCLSRQPIIDPYTVTHILAQELASQGITETLRIMLQFVERYQDFTYAWTQRHGQRISLIEYLSLENRPPETLMTPDGNLVPLSGLIELLAVGRVLGDVDLLGGEGGNAGFAWERNHQGMIIGAHCFKIDPGCALQIMTRQGEEAGGYNRAYNTLNKLGHEGQWQKDLRDIQVATINQSIKVIWEKLLSNQKITFLSTLRNCLEKLSKYEDILFFFFRDDKFHRKVDEEIPIEIAENYANKLVEWLHHQRNIYQDELKQFERIQRKDFSESQYALALRYEKGAGIIKSDEEAVRRLIIAAVQGHADAQFNLGLRYASGNGVCQSDEDAARLFILAGVQGHADALLNLGLCYANGKGVAQSYEEAESLYKLAEAQRRSNGAQRKLAWKEVDDLYEETGSAFIETLIPASKVGQVSGVYILINEKWVQYKKCSIEKEKKFFLHDMLASEGLDIVDFKVKLAFLGCQGRIEMVMIGKDGKSKEDECRIERIEGKAHVIEIIPTIVHEYVELELKFK